MIKILLVVMVIVFAVYFAKPNKENKPYKQQPQTFKDSSNTYNDGGATNTIMINSMVSTMNN